MTEESVADVVEGRLLKRGRSIVRFNETNAVRDTRMININRATSYGGLNESVGTRQPLRAFILYRVEPIGNWELG